MEPSSQTWIRKIFVAVALVVGLLAAALPASAAPTTKNYAAYLGSAPGSSSVAVPVGATSNVVTLTLRNLPDSQQSFGSAQLTFGGTVLPTAVSVDRSGWSARALSDTQWRLANSGKANPVPPAGELRASITLPATATGTTTVTTQVKQSNDFNGTNNDFSTTSGTLTIETTEPQGTDCPTGACTEAFPSSTINQVGADLTMTSESPFTYIAGFTRNRLSCDTIPFGPTVTPEPFRVDAFGISPVTKKLVLTFPKALANLVPDNGTPHHPVCAGGDHPFPGSSPTTPEQRAAGTATHPHEGLLLTCSDPDYAAEKAEADPAAFLPMCVASRARSAGKLVVSVLIEGSLVDPRIW